MWEVQPGKHLVLGDDLEREIPERNTPESGCSDGSRIPTTTGIQQSSAAVTAEVVFV